MSESQPQESGLGAPQGQSPSSRTRSRRPAGAAAGAAAAALVPASSPRAAQVPARPAPGPAAVRPEAASSPRRRPGRPARPVSPAAERFWYLLGNIALGAMYLRKVPAKKALSEFGLAEMTSGEQTWYTILCILCGAGYFAKLPVAKAISETPPFVTSGPGPHLGRPVLVPARLPRLRRRLLREGLGQEGAVRLRPGRAERHRGHLVHGLVHRLRSRLLRQDPDGQGRQRDAAVPVDRSRLDPGARVRNAATHPAEPVHLWGAVRKDRTPP